MYILGNLNESITKTSQGMEGTNKNERKKNKIHTSIVSFKSFLLELLVPEMFWMLILSLCFNF